MLRSSARRLAILPLLAAAWSTGCAATPQSGRTIAPSASASRALARLSFLAGCWEGSAGGLSSEETWLPPRGGTMLGVGRLSSPQQTLFFEAMRIEAAGDSLVLVATPRDAEPVTFTLTAQSDTHARFSRPEHDFPKHIEYHRAPEGGLTARVFGDEPAPAEELRFSRAPRCSAPTTEAP